MQKYTQYRKLVIYDTGFQKNSIGLRSYVYVVVWNLRLEKIMAIYGKKCWLFFWFHLLQRTVGKNAQKSSLLKKNIFIKCQFCDYLKVSKSHDFLKFRISKVANMFDIFVSRKLQKIYFLESRLLSAIWSTVQTMTKKVSCVWLVGHHVFQHFLVGYQKSTLLEDRAGPATVLEA